MTRPTDAAVRPEDVRVVASTCLNTLEPVASAGWDRGAGDLEWSCRTTLVHVLSGLLYYAINLATRATDLRFSGQADPSLPLAELLDALGGGPRFSPRSAPRRGPPHAGPTTGGGPTRRDSRPWRCDEMLLHTNDIAVGLGASFDPPRDVCARVLARLFPWAPQDRDPWEVFRWANGRAPLGDRPRLAPDWVSHPSPLDEWDGRDPNEPMA